MKDKEPQEGLMLSRVYHDIARIWNPTSREARRNPGWTATSSRLIWVAGREGILPMSASDFYRQR